MLMEIPASALDEIFVLRRAQLHRIARRLVGKSEIADEVIQDAYLNVAALARTRAIGQPFCYCCQVVRNVALDYRRRQAVEAAWRVYPEDGEMPQVAGASAPDRQLHCMQVLHAVERILGGLPARTRHVFELSRLGGLTQRDIALQVGCSATLVNFMLRDATAALADCRALADLA